MPPHDTQMVLPLSQVMIGAMVEEICWDKQFKLWVFLYIPDYEIIIGLNWTYVTICFYMYMLLANLLEFRVVTLMLDNSKVPSIVVSIRY